MLNTLEQIQEQNRRELEAWRDKQPNRYAFISTPGHGYLKVKRAELKRLGIEDKITAFSFISPKGQTVYLEEDVDLGTFLDALGAERGVKREASGMWDEKTLGIKIDYTHEEDGDRRIDRMTRYSPPTA